MHDRYREQYYPNRAAPDWHRRAVGGQWDEVGELTLDFLLREGLQPRDALLDVACGSLRCGVRLVRYLDAGNYVGTDIGGDLLDAGREELARAGLADKGATLIRDGDFRLAAIGRTFDVALAVSLFTHLPIGAVAACMDAVAAVLTPGGRFYATFFEADPRDELRDVERVDPPTGSTFVTHPGMDVYHQSFATMARCAARAGLAARYIGEWGHPRGQRMLRFTRAG